MGGLRSRDVTSRRAAASWRRKPRQRRTDATKELIPADAAFTRSRLQSGFTDHLHGETLRLYSLFFSVVCVCWEPTGE